MLSSHQVRVAGGLEPRAVQVKVCGDPARRGVSLSVTEILVGRKFMSRVIVFCITDPL